MSATETQEPNWTAGGETKARFVERLFDRIAPTYDLLNDAISFGLHRHWKRRACAKLNLKPGQHALDVCTGTGDLIQYLLPSVLPNGRITGVDFSQGMLAVARTRYAHQPEVALLEGDAMALPLPEAAFDGAIVAFGLRNVSDVPTAIAELVRVVRPGAWVVSLDTAPAPKLPGYWLYFKHVMPRLGRWLARDKAAYEYLSASTERFYTPQALAELMRVAGLEGVSITPQAFGAAAIVAGRKPAN